MIQTGLSVNKKPDQVLSNSGEKKHLTLLRWCQKQENEILFMYRILTSSQGIDIDIDIYCILRSGFEVVK